MSKQPIRYFNISMYTASFFALIIIALTSTSTFSANNNFNVRSIFFSFQSSRLIVFSQLDLNLSNELIDAINNGVAISIAVEYANPKRNLLGTSYKIITKTNYEIERHSLSNRYLVRNVKTKQSNFFHSIQAALDNLGHSLEQRIELKDKIKELAIKCYVDKYRLPGPLRFKAFFSKSWSPSSDWSIWPLNS